MKMLRVYDSYTFDLKSVLAVYGRCIEQFLLTDKLCT